LYESIAGWVQKEAEVHSVQLMEEEKGFLPYFWKDDDLCILHSKLLHTFSDLFAIVEFYFGESICKFV
jgi:hypothetical protein